MASWMYSALTHSSLNLIAVDNHEKEEKLI